LVDRIRKILIANRGEIAIRIIRACRELGIASIAVYSDVDATALHVRLADESVAIGPPEASESYLNAPRIIQAALDREAQAIHPGYGFLSENADFADQVSQAGLIFIGPSADAIQAMGNKAEARRRVSTIDVPVIEGYSGQDDYDSIQNAAIRIGYPLLVKAAAGGGGKGMRVVWESSNLHEAIDTARREAKHAFGDDRLILERYLPDAHHIEFQVLADQYGNFVHLFERECSVQRRHQKIIEETPSPLLDESLRSEMGTAALNVASAVGYTNAGTVEFIVDPQHRSFFFLEMNTRLQVEHPITELVTGLDLVQWQIRIAADERLPFNQDQLSQRGHAIECRLYAEDPANNFLPASGPILSFTEPQGPGIRVDSGFGSGDDITLYYDPLIAKVIAYGEDRLSAIRRLQAALRDTVLLGIPNNVAFLLDILSDDAFLQAKIHTGWVEQNFADWHSTGCETPAEVLIAAGLISTQNNLDRPLEQDRSGKDPFSPWKLPNYFRNGVGS